MAAGPYRRTRWLAVLGPGILFASTAIGVSHLVQSTRAGAIAGFGLLWAVVAANVAKYPFFEFGSRYANATGPLVKYYKTRRSRAHLKWINMLRRDVILFAEDE